jgi:hypothetical protein
MKSKSLLLSMILAFFVICVGAVNASEPIKDAIKVPKTKVPKLIKPKPGTWLSTPEVGQKIKIRPGSTEKPVDFKRQDVPPDESDFMPGHKMPDTPGIPVPEADKEEIIVE